MKQFVVYTVLTSQYDKIHQPLVIDERFDYILFSDNVEEDSIGVWKLKYIPYENQDKTRQSRYPKMHPNESLGDYNASLYIDANIQITSQRIYDRVIECYNNKIDWAGIKHPYRDCIYDEAYAIYGLDTEDNIIRWCCRLRDENYPCHRGLFENNVIFRAHNEITKEVNDMWWHLYEKYTRRDQLILYYVFWKTPELKISFLLPEGESAERSDTIQIQRHNLQSKRTRVVEETFWEHIRCRCRNGIEEKKSSFRKLHYWSYQFHPVFAKIILILWGIYSFIVYGLIIKKRVKKRSKF